MLRNRPRVGGMKITCRYRAREMIESISAPTGTGGPAGQWQVIIVDWGDLAKYHATGNATVNALAVGSKVAGLLKAARVPPSRVNLVGYSMGGTVVARIARDLKTRTAQVNTIVGIDP